jgi:hypothetical protein
MRTTTPFILLTLGLGSCGGGDADPVALGRAAMTNGDEAAALTYFNQALVGKTSADADYYELQIDRARALSYKEPTKVPEAISSLSAEATVAARDYRNITTDLVTAKAFVPAVEVMDLGMKAYPDDPNMVKFKDKVISQSKAAGDAGALKALEGMGYLGGD